MITDMERRPYRLRKRAESQEATRTRIVEALMALHEELGPRNTTISAIAERAGVQRLTVYRHFPDEAALLQACTSRWFELNPPPDRSVWTTLPDPRERCRAALGALYAYFATTQRMWEVSYRDEAEVEAMHEPMKAFRAYLGQAASDLLDGFGRSAVQSGALETTARHLVDFPTWASMHALGLDPVRAAELGCVWIDAARVADGVRDPVTAVGSGTADP